MGTASGTDCRLFHGKKVCGWLKPKRSINKTKGIKGEKKEEEEIVRETVAGFGLLSGAADGREEEACGQRCSD